MDTSAACHQTMQDRRFVRYLRDNPEGFIFELLVTFMGMVTGMVSRSACLVFGT